MSKAEEGRDCHLPSPSLRTINLSKLPSLARPSGRILQRPLRGGVPRAAAHSPAQWHTPSSDFPPLYSLLISHSSFNLFPNEATCTQTLASGSVPWGNSHHTRMLSPSLGDAPPPSPSMLANASLTPLGLSCIPGCLNFFPTTIFLCLCRNSPDQYPRSKLSIF